MILDHATFSDHVYLEGRVLELDSSQRLFPLLAEIMYAKPKRGKTAQGEWKDIVNVKDYTQTLRMEKCL